MGSLHVSRRWEVQRWMVGSMAALVLFVQLFGAWGKGEAQRKQPPPQRRSRRETNASRQARIQRTIHDTYAHRYEAFGGGGYLRWKSGPANRKNNEVTWAAEADRYLTPRLAVVGDARGSFGRAYQVENFGLVYPQVPRPQINEYFFTGGVNYRFYAKEKVALSVKGTGGVVWGIFSGGAQGLTGQQVGLWQDGFRPAFTANFNADYNFFPNLAFRVSPTYVGTTFGGGVQNNLGINAGVVYRFGQQR